MWENEIIFELTFEAEFAEKGLSFRAASLCLGVFKRWVEIVIIATELGHVLVLARYLCQEAIPASSLRRERPLTFFTGTCLG